METKKCPKCGDVKPIAGFYRNRNLKRSDGLAGWCISCERAAGDASVAKLRALAVDHLGGQCRRCGYSAFGPALQVDHVNGDGAQARKGNGSPRAILRAVLADTSARYQLLCANCNQIKRIENREHKGARQYVRKVHPGQATKYCALCATEKPVQDFYANAARRDGLSVYCGPCTNKHTAARVQRLRTAAIDHLGGACTTCGYSADRRALQIDHVNGDGAVGKTTGLILGRLYRDVAADTTGRYQLLCANCNVIKKSTQGEHRKQDTYTRNVATYRRPTKKYLSPEQIGELARLVAIEGVPQAEVGALFGIPQPVVARHTRNRYPEYDGRAMRMKRKAREALDDLQRRPIS